LLILCCGMLFPSHAQNKDHYPVLSIEVDIPEIIVQHIPQSIEILITNDEQKGIFADTLVNIEINGKSEQLQFRQAKAEFSYTFHEKETLIIEIDDDPLEVPVSPIPLWMSILPPLIAILIALLFREVFSALFIGLLIGTTIISFYQGANFFVAIFKGILAIIDTYIIESLLDPSHLSIIIFSMVIGATVNLITTNGGMQGVVNYLSKFAKSPRSGQFVTWLLGVMIFFDDYANTLVVGNTMRPVTDRLKISREKLAYIVDSTAAPIAAIAFVTTWIGAELGYIQDGIESIGIETSAYNVFLNSLAYSYYPIFTLIFILFLVFRSVDFGPMLKAEKRARGGAVASYKDGIKPATFNTQLGEKAAARPRWYNAAIPVFVIITGTFTGLIYTGWSAEIWNNADMSFSTKLSATIGNADSITALLWSSFAGMTVAIALSLGQRILNLHKCIESLMDGFKLMLTAVFILTLAWSLALITEHMHTAEFISNSMLAMSISPFFVPAITFILAAIVSFSTGSSWGTMAILYPLLLPASWLISLDYGLDHSSTMIIFYNVVSSVLAGSVLGDHCSPISDTTILSSLASSCNHIEHVRTQLPYAMTVGLVAIGVGTIPAAYGVPSYILFPVGILVLYLVTVFLGRKTS